MSVEQTKERIAIMQAYVDGKDIQVLTVAGWFPTDAPTWDWCSNSYRIAVKKPSVDWSAVSSEFNWLVADSDGISWLTTIEPILMPYQWVSIEPPAGKNAAVKADTFASFVPGSCDWKDSLVERPEGY